MFKSFSDFYRMHFVSTTNRNETTISTTFIDVIARDCSAVLRNFFLLNHLIASALEVTWKMNCKQIILLEIGFFFSVSIK